MQRHSFVATVCLIASALGLSTPSAVSAVAARTQLRAAASMSRISTKPTATTPVTRKATTRSSAQTTSTSKPSTKKVTTGGAAPTTKPALVPYDSPALPIGPGLIWSDEFESLSLASESNPDGLWRPNNSWQDLIGAGFVDYAGSNWNVNPNHAVLKDFSPFSIRDGALRIRAFRTPIRAAEAIAAEQKTQRENDPDRARSPKLNVVPEWCGGTLILNQEVRTVRYGYIEIRARLPRQGPGMFPALWLYAKTTPDTSPDFGVPVERQAAEIDLFEAFGVANRWATTLHRKGGDQLGPTDNLGARTEDIQGWHTYALEWKPTSLRVFRDGQALYEVPRDVASFFDVDMAIRMNVAVDAPWFGPTEKSNGSVSELAMDIDYVRVYRSKP